MTLTKYINTRLEYSMSFETPVYINGKLVKQAFWFCFEGVIDVLSKDIRLIPTRYDHMINISEINIVDKITDLDSLTDETICNLYSFKEGVQFLLMHIKDLCDRQLLMYMFSSPFMDDEELMKLLLDQIVLDNCDDSFLDHLAHNPNIYEL